MTHSPTITPIILSLICKSKLKITVNLLLWLANDYPMRKADNLADLRNYIISENVRENIVYRPISRSILFLINNRLEHVLKKVIALEVNFLWDINLVERWRSFRKTSWMMTCPGCHRQHVRVCPLSRTHSIFYTSPFWIARKTIIWMRQFNLLEDCASFWNPFRVHMRLEFIASHYRHININYILWYLFVNMYDNILNLICERTAFIINGWIKLSWTQITIARRERIWR